MIKKAILLLSFLSMLLFSQQELSSNDTYKANVSAKKAYERQQNGAVLIDVRTKNEYNESHSKDALNVAIFMESANGLSEYNQNFIKEVNEILKGDKAKEVLLICRTGSRSKIASNLLTENGFTNVNSVEKGFENGWVVEKLPIEKK